MNILVLGGTGFIGRHTVNALLGSGHTVTVFDRGRRGAAPAAATHILGDRDTDLDRLGDASWDATVDLSAYVPRQVTQLADELSARCGTYVLMSSTAVYAPPQKYGFREDAPQVVLPDPTTEEVNWDTYGGLKSLCEAVAAERFPARLVIRPTYVVGPYDFTGRFTYWVERIARGGEVLVPGPYDENFQLIDVQDLASWIAELLASGATGTYQAAKPFPPAKFGEVLDEVVACVAPVGTQLTWVDRSFLLAAGLDGDSLPLWPGANPEGVVEAADPSLALSSGLKTRSFGDTVRQIHEHEVAAPTPADGPVGLTKEQEANLLEQWHRRAD
jgi:2'-hydroxyisoflavone reductase